MNNISLKLTQAAGNWPYKKAVIFPRRNGKGYSYDFLRFFELEATTDHIAQNLLSRGIKKGDRALMFLTPDLSFHALVFALFRIGVVPVFIDPGMGRKNLLKCIQEVAPTVLFALPKVFVLKSFFPQAFASIKHYFCSKMLPFKNISSLEELKRPPKIHHKLAMDTGGEDLAAILYTSGGTGAPKGVEYTHNIFWHQAELLQKIYQLSEKDTDLSGFPLFSLFTLVMGATTCIPDMNPAKPGKASGKKLTQHLLDLDITFASGSPAIWENVARYCLKEKIILPRLKSLAMFGAPVREELHQKFKNILIHGHTYTPYGATESLPLCNISGEDILRETSARTLRGEGTCLGHPVSGVDIKIIHITEHPLPKLSNARELKTGEVGEIIVSGPMVTKRYYHNSDKTLLSKIVDPEEGKLWHRMGDLGKLDEQGRLWFYGRKDHRVELGGKVLYSNACEPLFREHHLVENAALIGPGPVGEQTPAIVVHPKKRLLKPEREKLTRELLEKAQKYEHTKHIQRIYFSKSFPVDIRHNIKIDRLKLKQMAEQGILQ